MKESKRRPGISANCACGGLRGFRAYHSRVLSEAPSSSVVELLDWVSATPRTYSETLEAWKTHCPRLSIWEDALSAGLIAIRRTGEDSLVVLTAAGMQARRRAHT